MLRGNASVLIVLTVAVAILNLAGTTSAQQLHTVPFDTDLSIYVGHDGTWFRYDIHQEEEAEIEDAVAVYPPTEPLDDDLSVWCAHQVNDPQPPAGWGFFDCLPDQPIDLHVVVHDAQNRLGEVVVTEHETGDNLGTLSANPQGSQVDGTVVVDPETEMFALDIKEKQAGARLGRAGVALAAMKDVLVFSLTLGWEPNVGDDHASCPASRTTTEWGDPYSLAGKHWVVDSVTRNACGGLPFENDQATAVNRQAKYNLLNKHIIHDIGAPPADLPGDGGPKVTAAIAAARLPYQGGQVFLPDYTELPYSRGVAHLPMTVKAQITTLLFFPYSGVTGWRYESNKQIRAQLDVVAKHEQGGLAPAAEIVAGWSGGQVTYEVLRQIGEPEPIGDLWAMEASSTVTPSAAPNEPITAPVTFELHGDLVLPPPGAPGLMGGTGTATRMDACTDPAPPNPMQSQVALTFPYQGDNLGKCTVQLAKGWKWKGMGADPHYNPGEVGPFELYGAETKQITATLKLLLMLHLRTGTTACQVELQKQVGEGWQSVGGGDTTLRDGLQVWQRIEVQTGTYRARANSVGRMG